MKEIRPQEVATITLVSLSSDSQTPVALKQARQL